MSRRYPAAPTTAGYSRRSTGGTRGYSSTALQLRPASAPAGTASPQRGTHGSDSPPTDQMRCVMVLGRHGGIRCRLCMRWERAAPRCPSTQPAQCRSDPTRRALAVSTPQYPLGDFGRLWADGPHSWVTNRVGAGPSRARRACVGALPMARARDRPVSSGFRVQIRPRTRAQRIEQPAGRATLRRRWRIRRQRLHARMQNALAPHRGTRPPPLTFRCWAPCRWACQRAAAEAHARARTSTCTLKPAGHKLELSIQLTYNAHMTSLSPSTFLRSLRLVSTK